MEKHVHVLKNGVTVFTYGKANVVCASNLSADIGGVMVWCGNSNCAPNEFELLADAVADSMDDIPTTDSRPSFWSSLLTSILH
jgi:hypothetical protein